MYFLRGKLLVCPLTLQININLKTLHISCLFILLFRDFIRGYTHTTAAVSCASGTPSATLALAESTDQAAQNEKDCCRKNHYDDNIC